MHATGLHATQLGTLGITGTQYSTYPEYSWLVLCVVLCYAVGVLCYVLVALYAMLSPAPQYLQYTAICQYGMEHCTVSHLTSSGPDRPRDPLVPAYGGAIGYRGVVVLYTT